MVDIWLFLALGSEVGPALSSQGPGESGCVHSLHTS